MLSHYSCSGQTCHATRFTGSPCADPEGGGARVGTPPQHGLENHKAIRFLSNTGPDLLENHNATKPAFNVGPL